MQNPLKGLRPSILGATLTSALGLMVLSCSDADFKSSNNNKSHHASADANGDQNIDANGDGHGVDANGNPIAVGESVSCSSKEVKNENETYVFNSNREAREFANSFCKAAVPTDWKSQGGLRDDDATKNALCRLKGFQKAVKVVSFSWDSPSDNHVAWWVEATKSFFVKKNASSNNHMIKQLTCQGRLYDQCVPAKETIDCKK